jgi:hypothetical protein
MAQRARWRRERVQVYNAPAKSTTRSLTALLPTLANLKQLSLARCKPAFRHPDDLRRVLLATQVRRAIRRRSDGTRPARALTPPNPLWLQLGQRERTAVIYRESVQLSLT